MNVQHLTSACVLIEHNGTKVLCDPWLTDGAYYGSWYHWPPLEHQPEDFADVDYIYISHVHPDHLDTKTLARLPKAIPILIHDFADKFMLRIIWNLGFTRVHELGQQDVMSLGDFTVQILAIDPIDTIAVFQAGSQVIVNVNDCHYEQAKSTCDYILKKYKEIDTLLVGYSGAGAYPQCFSAYNREQLTNAAWAKRKQFLDQCAAFINHLRPRAYMPFAGQYVLGGRLVELNQYRGVPELNEVPAEMVQREVKAEPLISTRNVDDSYFWRISRRRFDYDRDVFAEVPLAKLDGLSQAYNHMAKKLKELCYHSGTSVYVDVDDTYLWLVPMDGSGMSLVPHGEEEEPYIRIGLDYNLLQMILNRQAHWNNAEIGSHLTLERKPDVYERALYYFLSYLHT